MNLFQKKLTEIERWSQRVYSQAVKFFFLDIDQIRRNNFAAIDAESSGTAQKTLLKEEFYRTFIMIAGRIPYWAVLPAGLNDDDYQKWTTHASSGICDDFYAEDYIDLGNLTAIHEGECLGALLWQLYKARNDPVKSLIKAVLIVHYYFFGNKEQPLCDAVKKRFSERQLDDYLVDPYTLVFEKVIGFFKHLQDDVGLELLKTCIILRLLGYPFSSERKTNSPKKELLSRFMLKWQWSEQKVHHLKSYKRWSEQEKLTFDDRLFQKLTDLYELILRSQDKDHPPFDMAQSDLKILADQISIWFQKKPDKLPRCSAWLRSKPRNQPLIISCTSDRTGCRTWTVYDGTLPQKDNSTELFTSRELLRVIGWVFLNGFYSPSHPSVIFQPNTCNVSLSRAKYLLNDACQFLGDGPESPGQNSRWDKILVMLNGGCLIADKTAKKPLESAEILIENAGGEIFFQSKNLTNIENHLRQCYTVAMTIWGLMEKVPSHALSYRIYETGVSAKWRSTDVVEDLITKFKQKAAEEKTVRAKGQKSLGNRNVHLILDRFEG